MVKHLTIGELFNFLRGLPDGEELLWVVFDFCSVRPHHFEFKEGQVSLLVEAANDYPRNGAGDLMVRANGMMGRIYENGIDRFEVTEDTPLWAGLMPSDTAITGVRKSGEVIVLDTAHVEGME